ncbi:MAG: hypothetical protein WA294_01705 [Acidobacteriaceae bacterium]
MRRLAEPDAALQAQASAARQGMPGERETEQLRAAPLETKEALRNGTPMRKSRE